MSPITTFIDSGILIAAARSDHISNKKAIRLLDEPNRRYATSVYVQLEIIPKPFFNKRIKEIALYETFFNAVSLWAHPSEKLSEQALRIAKKYGLGGMDALHIAAALSVDAEELITIEGRHKPVHRVSEIKIISIHDI